MPIPDNNHIFDRNGTETNVLKSINYEVNGNRMLLNGQRMILRMLMQQNRRPAPITLPASHLPVRRRLIWRDLRLGLMGCCRNTAKIFCG